MSSDRADPTPIARWGEIWLTQFGTARGGEPGKNRPAVIISTDAVSTGDNNPRELVLVVPLSSSVTPSLLRPTVKARPGLDQDSVAVILATRGVARSRLLRRLAVLDDSTMGQITSLLSRTVNADR
ncbi:MAG: type II toxin-antitoxin system PemK/MazF family toxin [Propionibacteriaceae bacterium]|nr:type II toxin-antitoxin system PemK/MazF family toxin [Propionibacteriaceae bacterium]